MGIFRSLHTTVVVPLLSGDPRALLVAAQFFYLFFGIQYGFNTTWTAIILATTSAVVAEYALSTFFGKKFSFPWSALAAALGIGIFFRGASLWLFVLAGAVAIISKYVIKKPGGGHIFNPSNFAIVSLVFLFPGAATIEFTQWGSDVSLYALIAAISFFIAYRAGVIVTTLSFYAAYIIGLLLFLPFLPDVFSPHHYGLLSPSFVLFASFMITDPQTSPRGFYGRILHGSTVACMFFLLELFGVRYSLFVASFLVALATNLVFSGLRPLLSAVPFRGEPLLNLPTFVVTLVLLCVSMATVFPRGMVFSPLSISGDFLLRGIESPYLLRPPAHSVFVPSTLPFSRGTVVNGASWGDYNADGYDDLFVSDIGERGGTLYQNNEGVFSDVTESAGLPRLPVMSAYFADYDNDRRLDLFLRPYGGKEPIRVFRNTGGKFSEVTNAVGLGGVTADTTGGASLSFADYDRDGDLDFVAITTGDVVDLAGTSWDESLLKSSYDPFFKRSTRLICDSAGALEYLEEYDFFGQNREEQAGTRQLIHSGDCVLTTESLALSTHATSSSPSVRARPVYVRMLIQGSAHLFEQQEGNFVEHPSFYAYTSAIVGRTKDTTVSHGDAGYPLVSGRYFQAVSFDYNSDGLQDIAITSDFGRSMLLQGDGAFGFTDVTAQAGLDYSGSAMGIAVGDYNGDRHWDIVVTNVLHDFLFSGDNHGTFRMTAEHLGQLGVGWGTAFLDYNLDGFEDLFMVNGDTRRSGFVPDPQLTRAFFRRDNLYRNDSGIFTDRSGIDMPTDIQSGKALAVSDFNNDGSPDVFVGNIALSTSAGHDGLWKNTTTGPHWLKVALRSQFGKDNSFGIGSVISVTSNGVTQQKLVTAGDSFYSQNSSRILFGLGANVHPVTVEVRWPSGTKTVLSNVTVDQEVTVVE